MKRIFMGVLLGLLFVTHLIGQTEKLYVKFSGDTIKVWNTGVWENCGFKVVFLVDVINDSITVIEKDTAHIRLRCMCTFDLCTDIVGLKPGTYRLFLHRHYAWMTPETSFVVSSLTFTIGGSGSGVAISKGYQSECYNITSESSDIVSIPSLFDFKVYPNPFNPTTTISYKLTERSSVTLRVFNDLGKLVSVLQKGIQS